MSEAGFRTEQDGRAIIARRLHLLEHEPDYLNQDAVRLLLRHSGGSGGRLRAGLASILFLASTEDAPGVDGSLAARALGDLSAAAPPAAARPGRRLAVAMACFAAGFAVLVAHFVRQADPPVVLAAAPLRRLAPSLSPPATAVVEPPALPPLPPALPVRQMPVPPDLTGLPEGPPASVLLLFPARSARASAMLEPLTLQLREAGVADIRVLPATGPPSRRMVDFFYADDLKLAQLIADIVARVHWPHADGNSLQPSLVLLPPGLPAHAPGEVEVRLP